MFNRSTRQRGEWGGGGTVSRGGGYLLVQLVLQATYKTIPLLAPVSTIIYWCNNSLNAVLYPTQAM